MTYKLSQDHLENFFSAVRSRGGHSNNPTSFQFIGIFKKLLVHADVKESEHANCRALDDTSILKIPSDEFKWNDDESDFITEEIDQSKYNQITNINFDSPSFYGHGTEKTFIDNVKQYLTSFVVRKVLIRSQCLQCQILLTSEDTESTLLKKKKKGEV